MCKLYMHHRPSDSRSILYGVPGFCMNTSVPGRCVSARLVRHPVEGILFRQSHFRIDRRVGCGGCFCANAFLPFFALSSSDCSRDLLSRIILIQNRIGVLFQQSCRQDNDYMSPLVFQERSRLVEFRPSGLGTSAQK